MVRAALWLTVLLLAAATGRLPTPAIALVAVGALFALWQAAWAILGRERIEIEEGTLTLCERLGGYTRRQRTFRTSGIRGLRYDPSAPGPIAFEFAGRTFRFGSGLDSHAARKFAEELAAAVHGTESW